MAFPLEKTWNHLLFVDTFPKQKRKKRGGKKTWPRRKHLHEANELDLFERENSKFNTKFLK